MDLKQFEDRKASHIDLSLEPKTQALGRNGFEQIELRHEALPDINFGDIDVSVTSLGARAASPFFVSSMTAGHKGSLDINRRLAKLSAEKGWPMGVGSQRRELSDSHAAEEWRQIRQEFPQVQLLGNLGLAQLIETPIAQIMCLAEALEAQAFFIHLNPLQEALQPEGTTRFKGGFQALKKLTQELPLPVIVKETGSGMSAVTMNRLFEAGVAAVDVSGLGGTHWGRIEGYRSKSESVLAMAAETFKNWGISTVESLLQAQTLSSPGEIWASGGIRSGLDAAKAVALGAKRVGIAQPLLAAALESEEALRKRMDLFQFELKVAMFCTGCENLRQLAEKSLWQMKK